MTTQSDQNNFPRWSDVAGAAMVMVQWQDSSMQHGQVDADGLPSPSDLATVGWLSEDGPDHVVISRDRSPDPHSYEWRSSVAIPRSHIIEIRYLIWPQPDPADKDGGPVNRVDSPIQAEEIA